MLRIQNIRLSAGHPAEALPQAAAEALRIPPGEIETLRVLRRSYDCRRKPHISVVYTVAVSCRKEKQILQHLKRYPDVSAYHETVFHLKACGTQILKMPPVIIGSGPAGLFCALELARAGYCPVIAERGKPVEERMADVNAFWQDGALNPDSNIQFGEGGAGTFSDGKLSTGVRDKDGRGSKVLREFVHFGADPDILYDAAPHLGTDVLVRILVNMRKEIEALGGTFLFSARLDDIGQGEEGRLILHFGNGSRMQTQAAVLAIGNGAQDTFRMLYRRSIPMAQKSFAVGLRIEHTQEFADRNAYGVSAGETSLPHASYKLTAQTGGRGVYSFCMCPGGYVISSASSPGTTVVNGMSYHDRASGNANAAIVMTVSGKDFGSDHPLAGLAYQQDLEQRTYALCSGKVPQQRLADFRDGACSSGYGAVISRIRGQHAFADLTPLFTPDQKSAFLDAIQIFDRKIHGFSDPDAVLSGTESRTSSPVRILRNEEGLSTWGAVYPCGEGAGYAGGICSAAMDGLKTAQAISARFRPLRKGTEIG